ncbi:hypothetical protein O3M35_001235 [Rhynocoris fuscipes]|uniref:CHCH domain-containing protein n=1 Tax=Rhynocoris fuscipes TaxID=488301 RepID=A0AAW1DRW1_9HEMI
MSKKGPRTSGNSRRRSSPPPARSYSKAASPPASRPPAPVSSQGGTMIKDMAATAAGVALGSAIGHAVGAGVTGLLSGNGGGGTTVMAQPKYSPDQCSLEIMQLLQCAQEYDDITFCQAASNAFKKCLNAGVERSNET